MQKRATVLSALVFGLLILTISIWNSRVPIITLAVGEEVATEAGKQDEEMMVLANEETEEYSLPYPGILPDHPLYFLKMLRDRFQLWLTRDILTRAELLLNYADKRIAAALALAEKGKSGLAMTTASKAEKYLEKAVLELENEGIPEKGEKNFFKKFGRAARKHEKVLVGIASRVPEEALGTLEESEALRASLYEKAMKTVGGALNDAGQASEAAEKK